MSDPRKAYVGEIGKQIRVKVGISLSGLATATLIVEKPDGAVAVEWAATVLGPAEDGWIYYTTIAGDLDVSGVYRIYAKTVFTGGGTYYGERTVFNVYTPSEG